MSRGSGHFQIGQDPGKDVGEGEQPSMCGIIWLQHQRHTKLFFFFFFFAASVCKHQGSQSVQYIPYIIRTTSVFLEPSPQQRHQR